MPHIDKPIAEMAILAADDNDINRDFLLGVLTPCVAMLKVVADGTQAIAAAGADHYDVVLLDLHMPGHDGLQAMQEIRQHYHNASNEVALRPLFIAVTADARKTEQDRLLAAGFDGFLTKPIAASELISNIVLINEHPGQPLLAARTRQRISEQLNDKQALQRVDNNRALLNSLREKLLQELPGNINSIQHSVRSGDWQQAGQLAHKLAGGAAYTGAEMLADACQQLETGPLDDLMAMHRAHLHFREQAMQATALLQQSLQHNTGA